MPDKSVFSWQNIGISVIAGVAAAAMFAVVARGGIGGLVLSHLAPLPIMIVALGFGLTHAVSTAILAVAILSVATHPIIGMTYTAMVAAPAWLAAYAASGAPRGRRDQLTKNLPGWAALAPAVVLVTFAVVWLYVATQVSGGFDEALSNLRARLYIVIDAAIRAREGAPVELNAEQLSGQAARAMPAIFASYYTLVHILNLWIAARLAQASSLLTRPWPDIAKEFSLPRVVTPVFAIGVGLSFFDGLPHAAGLVLGLTFGLLLAFQGLAVVHELLRGSKSSVVVLSILYFVMGLMGWPLIPLAGLGAADAFFDFRARRKTPGEAPPN